MSEFQDDRPLLYTMRELHEKTASVIEAINTQDKPAVITRMGRFVGVIFPLANIENIEGKLFKAAIDAGDFALGPIERLYTADEVAKMLDSNTSSSK